LEETLVHESNFRETVKILVVHEKGNILGDDKEKSNIKARNLRDSGTESEASDQRDGESDTDPLLL
jgi:hypothetical protein